jgi:hypothetical protein
MPWDYKSLPLQCITAQTRTESIPLCHRNVKQTDTSPADGTAKAAGPPMAPEAAREADTGHVKRALKTKQSK